MNILDTQRSLDLVEELRWNPDIERSLIDIRVSEGVVYLFGTVDTYREKWAAEDAARRVCGMAFISEIGVRVRRPYVRSDAAIASAVHSALLCDVFVPNSVTAMVREGVVTLRGAVRWSYERAAAERATRYLAGVVSVSNEIVLTAAVQSVNDNEFANPPSRVRLTPIVLISVQSTPAAVESGLEEPEYDGRDVVFLAG